jgi:hypothetical protein
MKRLRDESHGSWLTATQIGPVGTQNTEESLNLAESEVE